MAQNLSPAQMAEADQVLAQPFEEEIASRSRMIDYQLDLIERGELAPDYIRPTTVMDWIAMPIAEETRARLRSYQNRQQEGALRELQSAFPNQPSAAAEPSLDSLMDDMLNKPYGKTNQGKVF